MTLYAVDPGTEQSKQCPVCGTVFFRRKGYSAKQWEYHKTCGHKCGEQFRRATWSPKTTSLAERFAEKVNRTAGLGPSGDCWEWTGSINNKGYGHVGLGGRQDGSALAHRVAWLLEYGRWPEPNALHHCDNPKCVRASHLFEGTQSDNMLDASRKGRI